jgi:hypothetical protein
MCGSLSKSTEGNGGSVRQKCLFFPAAKNTALHLPQFFKQLGVYLLMRRSTATEAKPRAALLFHSSWPA